MTIDDGIEYLGAMKANNPAEPVFILRGRDLYAPATIAAWAIMCAVAPKDCPEDKLAVALSKSNGAMDTADEFRKYQRLFGSKQPD